MSQVQFPDKLPKYVIIADTDGHGVTLGAALLHAFENLGITDVAVISHFNPKGLSTSARGDLIGMIREMAKHIEPGTRVYLLDIPTPIGKENDFAQALKELEGRGASITLIDIVSHHDIGAFVRNGVQLDPRLYPSVPGTFLPIAFLTPTEQVYDLATLGTVLEMDIKSLHELLYIRDIVSKAIETELPAVTKDIVRKNYHTFVAVDSLLKMGKVNVDTSGVTAIGNMAPKIVYFARTPIREIVEEALNTFKVPTVSDITTDTVVKGNVAYYVKVAPKGQGFKYASLVQAAVDAPIAVTLAEGFTPDKKIIIVTPNVFIDEYENAAALIADVKQKLFEELKAKGYSDEGDFPRGDKAISLGVNADKAEEALKYVVEFLDRNYANRYKERIVSSVSKEEILSLVADEKFASSLAYIIENSVKAATESVKRAIDERLERIERELEAMREFLLKSRKQQGQLVGVMKIGQS